MRKLIRARLTYANVAATLALFLAIGGTSYAALKISGRDIQQHTITSRNIKRNSLGGAAIRESKLGVVPKARNAARLGGLPADRFLVRCPEGTIPVAGVCIETQPRAAAPYGSAVLECAATDTKSSAGRRLPTHQELMAALPHSEIQLASGGELTGNVYPSSSSPGQVEVLYITSETGSVGITPDTAAGAKGYRCVTNPLN
jgi:hypothetical protein